MARTRSAFRKLADIRTREAKALLDAKCWDGAYYLAGYAVECGLKACVAKLTKRFDFPDKEVARRAWTHDLTELRKVAGLEAAWRADAPTGSPLELNWRTVKDWTEARRYDRSSQAEAEALYRAITDLQDGVLPWVRKYW